MICLQSMRIGLIYYSGYIFDKSLNLWLYFGISSMLWSSIGVIILSIKNYIESVIYSFKRYKMRTSQIMVGNKGPFNIITPVNCNH